MEWINKLNNAVEYIETHLIDEIEIEQAAKIAACSIFHFQRMFTYIAGVPLGEYIRRRRMTLAAFELTNSNIKIIDLAMKYGYDSPTAFSRAFQGIHGVSPSIAREKGALLCAFPRITFTLSIKGDEAMNYKIEKKDSIQIVGVKMQGAMSMEDSFEKVPKFWREVAAKGTVSKLCTLMDGNEPQGILGISTCDNGAFSGYYIAVASNKPVPEGMDSYTIPAGEWAIFECIGSMPDAIQKLQKRIISEWLPTSGYEYASAPDIEVYFDGDQSSPEYRSQVWLPIIKK